MKLDSEKEKEARNMMEHLEEKFWLVGLDNKEFAMLDVLSWLFNDEKKPQLKDVEE